MIAQYAGERHKITTLRKTRKEKMKLKPNYIVFFSSDISSLSYAGGSMLPKERKQEYTDMVGR